MQFEILFFFYFLNLIYNIILELHEQALLEFYVVKFSCFKKTYFFFIGIMVMYNMNENVISILCFDSLRVAAKRYILLVARPLRSYPPPSSLVATFFRNFFEPQKRYFFLVARILHPTLPPPHLVAVFPNSVYVVHV